MLSIANRGFNVMKVDDSLNNVYRNMSKGPATRLIRLPEVIVRVGLSRSAIYKRMADGTFPRNRSIGPKCAVWVEAEIDDWIVAVSIK